MAEMHAGKTYFDVALTRTMTQVKHIGVHAENAKIAEEIALAMAQRSKDPRRLDAGFKHIERGNIKATATETEYSPKAR